MVQHSTADPGIPSSTPLTPTKITKRRYVLVLPWKNVPVYHSFTMGTLRILVCHVWWALQYLALWAKLNKRIPPPPQLLLFLNAEPLSLFLTSCAKRITGRNHTFMYINEYLSKIFIHQITENNPILLQNNFL